jgi:hypothetical protein
MATLSFSGNTAVPTLNLVTSGPALFNLLNNYNRVEITSSQLEFSVNNDPFNQTVFNGVNLSGSGTPFVISSGTVTGVAISVQGFQPIVSISGLTIDAVQLGAQLNAGSQDLWSFFFSGDDTILGGIGNDVLRGFDGIDTATGGAGADDFAYFIGDDVLIITDFNPGQDQIGFGGLDPSFTLEQLLPFVSQQGDDVEIRSGDAAVIIQDTLLSEMSGADVFFFT